MAVAASVASAGCYGLDKACSPGMGTVPSAGSVVFVKAGYLMKLIVPIALAVLLGACSGEGTPVSTSTPTTTTAPAVSVTTSPPTTTTATTSTLPESTTTTTMVIEDGLSAWDAWTLIYASLETAEQDRGDAEVIASGIEGGEVLLSDDYPSLNPGYWVVYAGSWGDRQQASIWCPSDLDPALTCYPRYLGPSIPALLNDGAALAQLDEGKLAVLEPASGEVLATFSDNFHWEAEYPAFFNLTADSSHLYFGLGWEDSWYSCESDRGFIRRLDLDSGIEDPVGDGWSPAISPDGRWLAIVAAGECYPDPEVAGWVVSPGSEVKLYDLSDGDFVADRTLHTSGMPETYDDPAGVRRVAWDPTSDRDLLVWLADGSVRRIAYDSDRALADAELVYASEIGELAAISLTDWYLIEWDDTTTTVIVTSVTGDDAQDAYEIDGWVTGFALGRSGGVIITTYEFFILPSGERVFIDGGINNLAW
ncbi:MAG: hypothetical protein GY722_01600 [bacterium]|nr:hypothetical protein [bacterium]